MDRVPRGTRTERKKPEKGRDWKERNAGGIIVRKAAVSGEETVRGVPMGKGSSAFADGDCRTPLCGGGNGLACWKKKMAAVAYVFAALAFALELAMLPVYIATGFIKPLTVTQYVLLYIVRPGAFNGAVCLIGTRCLKSEKIRETDRQLIPVYMLVFLVFCIATVHYVFPAIMSLYTGPMFAAAVYGSRRIMKRTASMTAAFAVLGFALTCFDTHSVKGPYFLLDFAVFWIVFAGAYSLSYAMVDYVIGEENLIREITEKQNRMRKELAHDKLTGLCNYSTLMADLKKAADGEFGKKCVLAVLDIDLFKSVNDTYGHENGNRVLETLAFVMGKYESDCIRASRYGGEEFAVLFTDASCAEAAETAELIRSDFSSCRFRFGEKEITGITVSIGLAELGNIKTAGEFFSAADASLYEAKRQGRNAVYCGTGRYTAERTAE